MTATQQSTDREQSDLLILPQAVRRRRQVRPVRVLLQVIMPGVCYPHDVKILPTNGSAACVLGIDTPVVRGSGRHPTLIVFAGRDLDGSPPCHVTRRVPIGSRSIRYKLYSSLSEIPMVPKATSRYPRSRKSSLPVHEVRETHQRPPSSAVPPFTMTGRRAPCTVAFTSYGEWNLDRHLGQPFCASLGMRCMCGPEHTPRRMAS